MNAATNVLTISYPQDLLLSLKEDERGLRSGGHAVAGRQAV